MHTIKLNVGDSAYTHLMFLLKNLNTSEIQVVEDIAQGEDDASKGIECLHIRLKHLKLYKTL